MTAKNNRRHFLKQGAALIAGASLPGDSIIQNALAMGDGIAAIPTLPPAIKTALQTFQKFRFKAFSDINIKYDFWTMFSDNGSENSISVPMVLGQIKDQMTLFAESMQQVQQAMIKVDGYDFKNILDYIPHSDVEVTLKQRDTANRELGAAAVEHFLNLPVSDETKLLNMAVLADELQSDIAENKTEKLKQIKRRLSYSEDTPAHDVISGIRADIKNIRNIPFIQQLCSDNPDIDVPSEFQTNTFDHLYHMLWGAACIEKEKIASQSQQLADQVKQCESTEQAMTDAWDGFKERYGLKPHHLMDVVVGRQEEEDFNKNCLPWLPYDDSAVIRYGINSYKPEDIPAMVERSFAAITPYYSRALGYDGANQALLNDVLQQLPEFLSTASKEIMQRNFPDYVKQQSSNQKRAESERSNEYHNSFAKIAEGYGLAAEISAQKKWQRRESERKNSDKNRINL